MPSVPSRSFGEFVLNGFLKGQQLLHAWPLHHAIKMRRAMLETREVELELPGPSLAPEEMRIRRREGSAQSSYRM
jgi:hypothetical protein